MLRMIRQTPTLSLTQDTANVAQAIVGAKLRELVNSANEDEGGDEEELIMMPIRQ